MQKILMSVVGLLVIVIAATAIACNDDDGGGEPTGTAVTPSGDGDGASQLCSDIDELDAALANLDAVMGSGSLAEVEQAADDVEAAVRKVEGSAEGNIDELEAAWRDLDNQIRQDPSAAGDLFGEVDTAVEALRTDANC